MKFEDMRAIWVTVLCLAVIYSVVAISRSGGDDDDFGGSGDEA